MTDSVTTEPMVITGPTRVIVCFGPATAMTGFKAGEYFQAVIDPEMASPGGDYIRCDQRVQPESEVHGWQRCDALTVCDILDKGPENSLGKTVTMRAIVKE